MNKKQLQDTAKRHVPDAHKGRNAIVAFVSGGSLAVAAQLFMMFAMQSFNMKKDTAVTLTIVLVILITALLTGFGIYDKAAQKCGAGLFVPISGFANCLTSCAPVSYTHLDVYKRQFLGSNRVNCFSQT